MAQINLLMENVYDYSSRIRKERAQSLFNGLLMNGRSLAVETELVCHLPPPQEGMMWDEFGNPGFLDNQLL